MGHPGQRRRDGEERVSGLGREPLTHRRGIEPVPEFDVIGGGERHAPRRRPREEVRLAAHLRAVRSQQRGAVRATGREVVGEASQPLGQLGQRDWRGDMRGIHGPRCATLAASTGSSATASAAVHGRRSRRAVRSVAGMGEYIRENTARGRLTPVSVASVAHRYAALGGTIQ